MVSPALIFNGAISGFVGVLLGIIISLIVNCTLVEISISSFFSLYFGFLFIVVVLEFIFANLLGCSSQVGGIIIWRIFSQDAAYHKESATVVQPPSR
ncbi:unnamed protein product [Effrenium voratum]|nr:unnamed protein product [Effrenium voratum]